MPWKDLLHRAEVHLFEFFLSGLMNFAQEENKDSQGIANRARISSIRISFGGIKLKQPHAPRQTLVWTPDMDPRQQQAKPSLDITVSSPGASLKVSAPSLPIAELPQTRLKTAPGKLPTPSSKKKEPTLARLAKEERRLELLKIVADHDISEAYAALVQSGEWSLEFAKQRHRAKQRHEQATRVRIAGMTRAESLLRQWIDQRTNLLRWTQQGERLGQLQELDTYQWLWDDQPEPQPKLETFAILPQADVPHWIPWEIDAELEALNLIVPKLFTDRLRIHPGRLEHAQEFRRVCQVKLYNGLEIKGYLSFWHDHSLELVKSLDDPDSPRIFVLRHAIYQFLTLSPDKLAFPASTLPDLPGPSDLVS